MTKGNVHISYAFELQKAYEKGKAETLAEVMKIINEFLLKIGIKYDDWIELKTKIKGEKQ